MYFLHVLLVFNTNFVFVDLLGSGSLYNQTRELFYLSTTVQTIYLLNSFTFFFTASRFEAIQMWKVQRIQNIFSRKSLCSTHEEIPWYWRHHMQALFWDFSKFPITRWTSRPSSWSSIQMWKMWPKFSKQHFFAKPCSFP